jgi:hypothetical protein
MEFVRRQNFYYNKRRICQVIIGNKNTPALPGVPGRGIFHKVSREVPAYFFINNRITSPYIAFSNALTSTLVPSLVSTSLQIALALFFSPMAE